MKKILFKVAILAVVISGIQSCKKGEDDPFLSLRSRKARLSGEWKLTSYSYKEYTDGMENFSETYDGVYMHTVNGYFPFSQEFEFKKDGSYEIKTVYDGYPSNEKGNWVFMGKNKEADIEKKEYIFLDQTSYTDADATVTNSNFIVDNGWVYHIKKLSNKEIVFEITGSGYNDTYVITYTLSKK